VGLVSFRASAEAWRSLVVANARGLPIDFLIAWVNYESGGNPAALGAITEVGIFQVDMQSGPQFGGDVNTLHRNFAPHASSTATRPLTAAEKLLQVTSGIAMVESYRKASRAKLSAVGADWPEGSSDFWCLVKMHHGLPALPRDFLPAFKRAHGRAPATWDEWNRWMNSLSYAEARSISPVSAPYYFPDGARGKGPRKAFGRFTHNAYESGKYGGVERLGGALLSVGILLALFVAFRYFGG